MIISDEVYSRLLTDPRPALKQRLNKAALCLNVFMVNHTHW